MKALFKILPASAALLLATPAFIGCETTDGGGSGSASIYYGTGFYDPWYYGHYHDDGDMVVTPPPRPTHPIAPGAPGPRPTPLPSIPARPVARPR